MIFNGIYTVNEECRTAKYRQIVRLINFSWRVDHSGELEGYYIYIWNENHIIAIF